LQLSPRFLDVHYYQRQELINIREKVRNSSTKVISTFYILKKKTKNVKNHFGL